MRLENPKSILVEEIDYSSKLKRLKEKIGDRACVIALDEIDKLKPYELNDAIYIFKSLGKVGIVGISNTRKVFLTLDARNISRSTFQTIPFPPYSDEEIRTILKHRIVDCKALYPDTWSYAILGAIADLANGDARIAVQTLRMTASLAEKLNRAKIALDDVSKGFEDMEAIKKKYELEALSEHHRVLFDVIKSNPGISSSQLVERYTLEAEQRGLKPKSVRTLTNYMNELISLKHVWYDRASTKGNVRCFFATLGLEAQDR